jgi:hypothetical protein
MPKRGQAYLRTYLSHVGIALASTSLPQTGCFTYKNQTKQGGKDDLGGRFCKGNSCLSRASQIQRGPSREVFLVVFSIYRTNPVRAGMVNDPGQYRWSSYRHNGLGQNDKRLTPHNVFLALDASDQERQSAYRALFRTELDEAAISDIRLALAQSQPLGSNRFSEKLCEAVGVRRSQARRGRPVNSVDNAHGIDVKQTGFGF